MIYFYSKRFRFAPSFNNCSLKNKNANIYTYTNSSTTATTKKNSDLANFLGHWSQSEECSEIKPPLYG